MGFDGISGKDKKAKKKNSVHDYVMSDEGGLGHLTSISKMAELNLLFFWQVCTHLCCVYR